MINPVTVLNNDNENKKSILQKRNITTGGTCIITLYSNHWLDVTISSTTADKEVEIYAITVEVTERVKTKCYEWICEQVHNSIHNGIAKKIDDSEIDL